MLFKKAILSLFILLCYQLTAQDKNKVDSLLNRIHSNIADSEKVKANISLLTLYKNSDEVKSLYYGSEAVSLATKINFKRGIQSAYINKALVFMYHSANDSAIFYSNKALQMHDTTLPERNKGLSYNLLGAAYFKKGNYPKALSHYLNALSIFEKIKAVKNIPMALNNIGLIYDEEKQFDKALEVYRKCIKVNIETGNEILLVSSYNNLGLIFSRLNMTDSCIFYYTKSVEYARKFDDKTMLAQALNNIGVQYSEKRKPNLSITYFQEALKIREAIDDIQGKAQTLMNIGTDYYWLHNYEKAQEYFDKSLAIARQVNANKEIKELYVRLSDLFEAKGDYKKSLNYFRLYKTYNDSLFNAESNGMIAEMNAKYESDKKDKEILLLNKDKALQESEINKQKAETARQNTQRNAFIIGFGLVLALAVISLRGYRQKQKANKIIETQKMEVEEKNKAITDSIQYAKRIQNALMASEKYIEKSLNKLNKD